MCKNYFFLMLLIGNLFWQCSQPPAINKDEVAIIPLPKELTTGNGYFILNEQTQIVFNHSNEEVVAVAEYLREVLSPSTGFAFNTTESARKNVINLVIDTTITGNQGVYKFESTPKIINITAPDATGLFYGVQTLRQLLPAEAEQSSLQTGIEWKIPAVTVFDEPSFQYRGLHLDVSRHFFPVSFVKKYIDLLAFHKMNKLHWHLTDDQGWRIEIKKYPLLTEISSNRKETLIGHGGVEPFKFDGKPYGGFYSQDEVKEVVAYAQSRHITVIPEIEMPGHSQAVLAAYPNLGCTGGPYDVVTRWGVFDEVFCAGNDEVFTFMEDVLLEVMELFPSKYIHIGGDECPKTRWESCKKCQQRIKDENLKNEHELQSYFIQRIEKFLNAHGRQIIGWDEILEGGLAPGATVMSWRGEAGGIEAAKLGHDVIMTPNPPLYLDSYQADHNEEPLAIGGLTTLEKVYSYYPVPDTLTQEEAVHILGAQGNLWSEYLTSPKHVEYMAYPRAIALSEVVWSDKSQKNYDDFVRRLKIHLKRLDAMNVNYFNKLK